MIDLHPAFLEKDGKNAFAILPYEEYEALLVLLEDVEDLIELRLAKEQEKQAPTLDLEAVKKLFK